MKKHFTRWLAMLLAMTMVLAGIPAVTAEDRAGQESESAVITPEQYAAVDELWEQINDLETKELAKRSAASVRELDLQTVADFVEDSDLYVDGSMEWKGADCFTFMTTAGVACKYSARVREELRGSLQWQTEDDTSDTQTVSYGTRGASGGARDVYLIEPYYGIDTSFTTQYQQEAQQIAQATGGTYILKKQDDATIDAVAKAIENGAVVIFDSHGDTDYMNGNDYTTGATTSYLCLQSGTGITAADYANDHAYYGGSSGKMKYYEVDGTAITNHMQSSAKNCIVWMAICLGMATDGLEKPLMEHGAGVVYGYSQSVTFDGDYLYEETFWDEMRSGATVASAIAKMKTLHGYWDPAYSNLSYNSAIRNDAAFPIVVSNEDVYPGHGNVDTYQTVYSTWTLLGSQYTVTAKSADESKGTVSLSGMTITASPKTGYYASGCTVSPENAATVTQNGNEFVVSNLTQDCVVTIEFSEKTPASIRYCVPSGVTQDSTSTWVGDAVVLPTPTGTPDADAQAYTFVGWTDQAVADAVDCPTVYPAGSNYTVRTEETTLYALYSYRKTISGDENYRLVTEERTDWSGEYVITGGGVHVLRADGSVSGTNIGKSDGAVTFADAGLSVSGDVLNGVTDDYVYQIEKIEGTDRYSVRMKNGGLYLTCTTNSNSLNTSAGATSAAEWNVTYANGSVILTSALYTARRLQYNASDGCFRCYTGGQTYVTLYGTAETELHYTTEPGAVHIHSYTSSVTAPTCTEQGYTLHTCACGDSYTDTYTDALGHDWDGGEVTKEATETATGETTYTCLRCGETKTEELPKTECPSAKFTDVDTGRWYHKAIDFALTNGLMSGISETVFAPNASMSRGMLVTVLYRLEGKPTGYSNPFTDVAEGRYYSEAVKWAAAVGVVNGVTSTTFNPQGSITREQVAAILYRYAAYQGRSTEASADLSAFTDAASASRYALTPLQWAVGSQILNGDGTGRLNPKGSATRAEVAQMLMKFIVGSSDAED